ncbi:MAG: tRNA (adenosine(37)-N6)-threonylcarbamoyltransferase complex dimerization subunit type 1 TsaB [Gloeobacteraceae cyanobacterium ES-bin-316]|nr:tRNA (adenosine(37)-N6)-threonylcarbamoyltransferase complex dimerization subunit type 1 TsaB [Ferruginibacter sp.]
MSLLLNIDTFAREAVVSISKHGELLDAIINKEQNEHASFLQPAIKKLLAQLQIKINDLDAVAVVNGPGSYTGLRVGLASAKGICYALGKPLITIGSLPLMARACFGDVGNRVTAPQLVCPMIDARRQEVFTAIYNSKLDEIFPPQALILYDDSFVATLLQNQILFFGDGAAKFQMICNHPNALFAGVYDTSRAMCILSYSKFIQEEFTNLALSEPQYLKEFYTGK